MSLFVYSWWQCERLYIICLDSSSYINKTIIHCGLCTVYGPFVKSFKLAAAHTASHCCKIKCKWQQSHKTLHLVSCKRVSVCAEKSTRAVALQCDLEASMITQSHIYICHYSKYNSLCSNAFTYHKHRMTCAIAFYASADRMWSWICESVLKVGSISA